MVAKQSAGSVYATRAQRRPARVFAVTLGLGAAAALALLSFLGGAGSATSENGTNSLPFWRITDPARPDAALYALATVALSQQETLRFDSAVMHAFEQSQRLVLPNSAALSKQLALLGAKAHLAEGDHLAKWLPPALHAGYVEAIGRGGFGPTIGDVTAPWFAARVVRLADLKHTGFEHESELETYFAHLAAERGEPKQILPLEESAQSYDRAAALSREIQVQLVQRALFGSERVESDLPAAAAAWKRGDAAALDAILRETDRAHPELAESRRLTLERENERLADGAARLLAEPGSHSDFLLAESGNLLGPGGVLERLGRRGLNVEAVAPLGGTADPYPAPPVPVANASGPAGSKEGTKDRSTERSTERTGRVLLVGIDGATLRIIHPLIAAGRLPSLAALAREGASGPLRSHRPIYSPRIWNSIATGKTPEAHGIEGFTYRSRSSARGSARDDAQKQRLYLSIHRKAHALWNIASAAGLRVGVVNWWNTYPPEVVNGVMISDHAKPTRLDELRTLTGAEAAMKEGTTVFPDAWQARVSDLYAKRLVIPGFEDPFLGNLGIPGWMHKEELSKRFRDDAAVARIALELEAELHPDVMLVFLPGIDRVSHRLWAAVEPPERYARPPDLNAVQRAATRAALERYYEYTDGLLGLLTRDYGVNDLVMVVSDHGFEAGEHLGDLTGVHESEAALDGIVFARGPGIAPGSETAGTSVNDVTPTILAWLGLPVGRDMQGQVASFVRPRRKLEKIATHDTGEIERVGLAPSGSEEEILDQLRALGYIE
jgi:uncharacterized protein YbaP (TraB family)